VFADWVVYAGTIAAFVLAAVLVGGIPALLRLAAGRKHLEKSTDLMARASFQKGGIHHTRSETGLLIFIALLERQVAVIPDRGVELALPPEEWGQIRRGLNGIFQAKNPAVALLAELEKLQTALARHHPQTADDLNELPDHLEIEL
jgi:putative membrane protein